MGGSDYAKTNNIYFNKYLFDIWISSDIFLKMLQKSWDSELCHLSKGYVTWHLLGTNV